MADELISSNKVQFFAEPTELTGNKTPQETEVTSTDFIPAKAKAKRARKKAAEAVAVASEPYLIIGFDTEFKTPEYHVSREQIVAGEAKYRVLSDRKSTRLNSGHLGISYAV